MSRLDLRVFVWLTAFFSASAFAGVVGTGTPSSCTESALASAIAGGGTVTFNCGTGPQTIPFTFPLGFSATAPKVTIDGGDTITLDGTGMTAEMLAIFGSSTALADVTLRHITLANGNIASGLQAGGAIQNFGRLTLDGVTLKNNHSAGSGGAIFQELCTGCGTATLVASRCLFQSNSGGGAISIEGGIAEITDSTFRDNTAASAGALEIYSNSTFTVDVTIDRCTFTGNTATSYNGGAIGVELLNRGSVVRITNDTFTGNAANGPGKGSALSLDAAPVIVTNCTIAGNTTATAGNGAVYFGSRTNAMFNTIVANNSGGNCSADGGAFTGGHNLQFGDSSCVGVTVADPLLSPLASNGGPTQTMALGAGSPAIDAADGTMATTTDQRGFARTDGNNDGVVVPDIGAYEAAGTGGNPLVPPNRKRAVGH